MNPSDPQSPVDDGGSAPPSTQEIPVVQPATGATATQQLPPHPGASTPAPVQPVDAPTPTGPVDFVPGLPGPGTPPPPPPVRSAPVPVPDSDDAPAAATSGPVWPETLESPAAASATPKTPRAPRDRAALVGLGLTVVSIALLELGLTMRGGDVESYWERIPLWSAFATVCAVLGLAAVASLVPAAKRLSDGTGWRVAAAGLVGLAAFWLLVVLPVVDSDRGFVLTAALAALGGALWIAPRQKKA